MTGSCKAGYYCARGSNREDPTDGVTGDICPAGRYCSEYKMEDFQYFRIYFNKPS